MKRYIFLFCFLLGNFAFSQKLLSGPMLGYVEMTEAKIWIQTSSPQKVKIQYYPENNPNKIQWSEEISTTSQKANTGHLVLAHLEPSTKYHYSIYIDGKSLEGVPDYSFVTKRLWQWREDAPDFSIAFGSCAYVNEEKFDRPGIPYASDYKIFESIADKKPDIMIWGGDNIYLREADWDSRDGIYHRYTHTRQLKEMQRLLHTAQNFAIWDDHDFGPNDSDRSFYNKHITLEAFQDFWANKPNAFSTVKSEGNYSTFSWGDADFFLLDNRFFKSPNKRTDGEKTILGNTQKEWLMDALSSSSARYKIIVIGGQFLNDATKFENYANYADEKQWLLSKIEENNISGVLFLTGDRHFSELSRLELNNGKTLYDWTVSPLTSGVASETAKKEENHLRVPGSQFMQHAFGILKFSGKGKDRKLSLHLYNAEGNEIWQYLIP